MIIKKKESMIEEIKNNLKPGDITRAVRILKDDHDVKVSRQLLHRWIKDGGTVSLSPNSGKYYAAISKSIRLRVESAIETAKPEFSKMKSVLKEFEKMSQSI